MTKWPRVRKAIIPVAGYGTRFLPATKAIPKELLPLVDKPILQYIVEEAVSAGIEEIIFITSDNKTAVEKHFTYDTELETYLRKHDKQEMIDVVRQPAELARFLFIPQETPLGLGHAVLQAQKAIGDEPFIVFVGDDMVESATPAAQQLIDVYQKHGEPIIAVMEVPEDSVDRYGVIDPEEQVEEQVMRIRAIVEKPEPHEAPSHYAVVGRWLLTPDIFTYLEHTPPGAGGEIQLTDAICARIPHAPVFAKNIHGVYRDCGNKLEYMKAVVTFARKHPEIGKEFEEYIRQTI